MGRKQQAVTVRRTEPFSEFDLLLAAIPAALLAGAIAATVAAIPQLVGISAGATLACLIVGYSIYAVGRLQAASDTQPAGQPHLRQQPPGAQ